MNNFWNDTNSGHISLAFVLDKSPSQHDRIQFTWRHEAAWTLLWAMGFVAQLGKPAQICDVGFAAGTMAERTTSQFIEDSELRPIADILDQADLVYRYHWTVRNARIGTGGTGGSRSWRDARKALRFELAYRIP
uniref:DUF4272 domain-containing protein n=1 Tax=Bradyrhizobium sp. WSM471 TaxID=319017 RepID=UPI0018DED61F|nr:MULTISPECIES: DUF4272 domain-containing protein [Bradyrhizobium]